jgi:hypothetical protein
MKYILLKVLKNSISFFFFETSAKQKKVLFDDEVLREGATTLLPMTLLRISLFRLSSSSFRVT